MRYARTSHAVWVFMTVMVFAAATVARGQEISSGARAGKRRAFLVACQNYPRTELNRLKYTHADILGFQEALLHTGFSEDDIVLLYDPEEPKPDLLPKAANIRGQLKRFLESAAVDDTLIVALSGHGVQFQNDKRNYFCPVDAVIQDRRTLIDLTELYEILRKCLARRKLLLVDACRNDPFADLARSGRQVVDLAQPRVQDVPEGIAALFSCSPGEKSYEYPDLRHGIFFYHLLEAWNGAAYDSDDKLTLGQLFDYTAQRTRETVRTAFAGAVQRPQQKAEASGSWELWKGHVGELGRFKGHERGVCGVAFCPDGRTALSGSLDDTVRLWDLRIGKVLHCFKGPQTPIASMVYSVAVSPTGRYALSGSSDADKVLRLWDLKERKEQDALRGHMDAVYAVAFSLDGRYALSGGLDRTVRLWDLKDATEQHCFQGHKDAVYGVAFSPDGRYALSGSADATVRLWDRKTGKERHRMTGHKQPVRGVVFSPNSQRILSGGDDGTIRLWDVETGIELRRFQGHADKVLAIAFSPDREGRRILSGGADGTMRLWDTETVKELHRFDGRCKRVLSVAFSPDGRRALSGGLDGSVRLWDLPRK